MTEVISCNVIFVGNRTELPKCAQRVHIGAPRALQVDSAHKFSVVCFVFCV